MLRRSAWLLLGLLLMAPIGFGLYSAQASTADALRQARLQKCGVEYRLLIRQILERVDQSAGQQDSPLLVQLGMLAAQSCTDDSSRGVLTPDGSVENLKSLAEAAVTPDGRIAYEQALYALMAAIENNSAAASDASADGRYASLITQNVFAAAMPVLTRLSDRTRADHQEALNALGEAVEQRGNSIAMGASARPGSLAAATAEALEQYRAALHRAIQTSSSNRADLAAAAQSARDRLCSLFDNTAVGLHDALQRRIDHELWIQRLILAGALAAVALLGLMSFGFFSNLTKREQDRRLELLVRASQRTASGELGLAVDVRGKGKVAELEVAFNQMAADLRARYQKVIDEAEAARATAEGARRYLRNLADRVPGAIFEFVGHDDGRIKLPFASAGFESLLGVHPDKAAKDIEAALVNVLDEDKPGLLDLVRSATGDDAELHHDFRVRDVKSGETRWLHLHGSHAHRLYDGTTRRFGMISDLSAQKRLEVSLESALENAQRAERFKSDFMRNVSHEIRTPMIAITGMSHMALQTKLDTRQREYLEKIQQAAKSLTSTINDILDFSKLEGGLEQAERIEFDLSDVLDPLVDDLREKALAKQLRFGIELPADIPRALVGDPERMGKVLKQFLLNAIKFTERGHVDIKVSLLAWATERIDLRFTVIDTGIGMSPEQKSRLFQSVSQNDGSTARKYGGTGLGLVVGKRMADLMGARVGAESDLGEGSAFWIDAGFGLAKNLVPRALRPMSFELPGQDVADSNDPPARPSLSESPAVLDPALLDTLISQIETYDSMATETVAAIRDALGNSTPSQLSQIEEYVNSFAFDEAQKLTGELRTALLKAAA